MKILKPGKVEMRKFVCQECGCTFVAYEADAYDDYIKCPQGGCESIVSWKYEGEPYEEPTQDDREPISRECIVNGIVNSLNRLLRSIRFIQKSRRKKRTSFNR